MGGVKVVIKFKEKNMCQAASFILTKENVYFSEKHDSHEDIIKKNKLDVANCWCACCLVLSFKVRIMFVVGFNIHLGGIHCEGMWN